MIGMIGMIGVIGEAVTTTLVNSNVSSLDKDVCLQSDFGDSASVGESISIGSEGGC